MNSWGLKEKDIQLLRDTLAKFLELREVRIFGSRAMGNFKPGSDVDMALFGEGPLECTTRISSILNEELALPYFFDVIDYHSITNLELKKHIDEVGKTLYRK